MGLLNLEKKDFLRNLIDAIPSPIFIVDADVRVFYSNLSASRMVGEHEGMNRGFKGGDLLSCIRSKESEKGCGDSESCRTCVIRNAVNEALRGRKVHRQKTRMQLIKVGKVTEVHLLITTAPFEYEGRTFVLLILEDVSELTRLRSLLPICAHCKKIRNDENYWESVETYFRTHIDVNFTHGICPSCVERLYPELYRGIGETYSGHYRQ